MGCNEVKFNTLTFRESLFLISLFPHELFWMQLHEPELLCSMTRPSGPAGAKFKQRQSEWQRAGRAARCCPHPKRVKLKSRACHEVILPVPEFTSTAQTPWSQPNIYFNKHWDSFQRPVVGSYEN